MAEVAGTTAEKVIATGRALGLGKPPAITADQQARSYLTVIKRNWHLLPYNQLLQLLGWNAEKLAYTLREDDFLFVKLGNLKPDCEPLGFSAPDDSSRRREREIRELLQEEALSMDAPKDPLFGFVKHLSEVPERGERKTAPAGLRYCYSYFALYGDPLLEPETDPYPDGLLARLAEAGVTGVWLQAVLYKLAQFPWQPDLSKGREVRLASLRSLSERIRKHGLRLFLYLNEPRAMPLSFFDGRPELKGAVEGDHAVLCTSVPEVRGYLAQAVVKICEAAPDLGGFFTISASENLTNCWSHGGGAGCPRCSKRSPAEVIAEVNTVIHQGIAKAGTGARLIAWDWGWNDAWAGEVIQQLPKEVAVMSVSEWRLPIERGGVPTEVGEYSISAVGPGPRAKSHWAIARERSMPILAKIQAGNTWELSSVPYIPALENVARHAENLSKEGVTDLMLGWTLGGYPSPNLEVVSATLSSGSAEEGLRVVAERRFGEAAAPAVIRAWREFSAAFREFPYHIGVVYSGPQQLGPANLLWPERTGYAATMVGFPYDDLDGWRSVYPPEVFASQMEKVGKGFKAALVRLGLAVRPLRGKMEKPQRAAFESECVVAEAASIHFLSVANQVNFVLARRALSNARSSADAEAHLEAARHSLRFEIDLARRLYALQRLDSRLGFEASNHYFFVPVDLAEKVLNCQYLLNEWLTQQQRRFA
jgi:hypothetical protein